MRQGLAGRLASEFQGGESARKVAKMNALDERPG